jgi:hypothetical protein
MFERQLAPPAKTQGREKQQQTKLPKAEIKLY